MARGGVPKYFGGKVIATGRNASELKEPTSLGAYLVILFALEDESQGKASTKR